MNFAKCQGERGGGSGARLHRTPTRAVLNGEVSPLHSLTVIYDMSSRLSQMPVHCEVVEIRNSADEIGYPCSRTSSTQCSDCGSDLCESHTETCGGCRSIFFPSCLTFHQQHSKPASADHGKLQERKRA